jgi:hypothetical protein
MRKHETLEHLGPHLSESRDALGRILALHKELLFTEAEERLQKQARRATFLLVAVFVALLFANNLLLWLLWDSHP